MTNRASLWFLPLLIATALASYLILPDYLALVTEILTLAIFALSYDLLQGHAGIVSLGHASFFGIGAYTAALVAKFATTDPLIGLAAAALLAAATALVLTPIIARGNDLTRLLITLGVGALLVEAANRARWLTNGADGLSDFDIGPLIGLFPFDFRGITAFWYALTLLALTYLAMWRIVTSPFGLALTGIRENPTRMAAIGAPTPRHIAVAYTISGAFAGVAGALLTQTSRFASIYMLGFDRSAEAVMVATFGGTGSIHGVVLGAAVYGTARDTLSILSPKYWQLALGFVLMASVLAMRGGIAGGVTWLTQRLKRP